MPRIFISYRRADTLTVTGRLYDYLVSTFGEDNVFKDVDSIPAGADFRAELNRAVDSADILLVMIGQKWLGDADSSGRPRLHDPDDFVRVEAEHALAQKDMLVIPVLAQNTPMPSPQELPESLRELAFRNAAVLRDDPDFRRDATKLIERIQEYLVGQNPVPPPAEPVRVQPTPSFAPTNNPPAPNPAFNWPAPAVQPGTAESASAKSNPMMFLIIVGGVILLLCAGVALCSAFADAGTFGGF